MLLRQFGDLHHHLQTRILLQILSLPPELVEFGRVLKMAHLLSSTDLLQERGQKGLQDSGLVGRVLRQTPPNRHPPLPPHWTHHWTTIICLQMNTGLTLTHLETIISIRKLCININGKL